MLRDAATGRPLEDVLEPRTYANLMWRHQVRLMNIELIIAFPGDLTAAAMAEIRRCERANLAGFRAIFGREPRL